MTTKDTAKYVIMTMLSITAADDIGPRQTENQKH